MTPRALFTPPGRCSPLPLTHRTHRTPRIQYSYLVSHPDIVQPAVKESNFFTGKCEISGYRLDCQPRATINYLNDMRITSFSTWKVKGQRASFDATPKIFDLGAQGLARVLREKMPWVKLVVSYREPISRSISKHVMLWDKNQTTAQGEPVCMNQLGHDLAFCLEHDRQPIMGNPRDSYYSHPLQAWIDAFPTDQIHVIQVRALCAIGVFGARLLIRPTSSSHSLRLTTRLTTRLASRSTKTSSRSERSRLQSCGG